MSGSDNPRPFKRRRDADGDDRDWEIRFFEGIVENSPSYVDALINLGNLYTTRGDFVKGLEVDRRLVVLRPDDQIVHYNLACSLSLVGDLEGAFHAVKKAVELGYTDYGYMLKDDDLANVRSDPRFCEFIESMTKPI